MIDPNVLVEFIPLASHLIILGAVLSIGALVIEVMDLIKKNHAINKFKAKLAAYWAPEFDKESTNCMNPSIIEYLAKRGELERLDSLIKEKKSNKSDLTLEQLESLMNLRTWFILCCQENLNPDERKQIMEGLYRQNSELGQARYILQLAREGLKSADINYNIEKICKKN